MAVNNDFSALRLKKETISVFQSLKLAYESRNFVRVSNDEFFMILKELAETANPKLAEDFKMVRGENVVEQEQENENMAQESETQEAPEITDAPEAED